MPAVAVIVLAIVAVLLVAMLLARTRKSATGRAAGHPHAVGEDANPYRSHAEASRHEVDEKV